tara:strand:- start:4313 stop:4813 length:501 start_codon:yes stop_codon:yes gene_type:complete
MKNKILLSIISLLFIITQGLYSQDIMPSVYIKNINGKSINSKTTYNKKGLTVYSFWATWCVPCINELDNIHKEIEKWNEANVKIVAISTDDSRTKRRIRPLVNGKKWSFEILLDENQALKRALNINGIPHTIVTKGNKIIYRKMGYKPGEENDLYEFILKNSIVKN